jgi:tetratricopeptide (TPR) repeat protein
MEILRKVKRATPSLRLVVVSLLLISLFAGCGQEADLRAEVDERAFRRGKSLLREGRRDEALQAFLSVIRVRADAEESHLESGLIYLNHIKDPLSAIFHFRQYLSLAPEGEHAEFVEELVITAQRDYLKQLPGQPLATTVDRVDLLEQVKALKDERTGLKARVLELESALAEQGRALQAARARIAAGSDPVAIESMAVAPIIIEGNSEGTATAQPPESYIVQEGDTLSRISARVYGSSGRWMDIFQANRDQLPSPNALRPGQELRIP